MMKTIKGVGDILSNPKQLLCIGLASAAGLAVCLFLGGCLGQTPPLETPVPATPSAEAAATPAPTLPSVPTPAPLTVRDRFNEEMLQHGNNDIVGHLSVPGTTIDYPVLQSDDNEYYLTHDIDGNKVLSASIFLDWENDIARQDYNSIIYGHNMNARIMFHDIRLFKDESFYQEHPTFRFDTLYEDQTWEIFAFYKADVSFPYILVNFPNDNAFNDIRKQMQTQSQYDTGVTVLPGDRVLNLSTCSNQETDTRLVLSARLATPYDGLKRSLASYAPLRRVNLP